jgi:LL-diaminopimelate aminotransferase
MTRINENYLKLQAGYLFPEIGRRVAAFEAASPDGAARLIRCGIGDVTEPLPGAVRDAMHRAVDELGQRETFRGYGPGTGYSFLRDAIVEHDFRAHGLPIDADEIFVSDGSKGDCGAILDILGEDNRLAITDPVYPVYVDTNVMAGHTGPSRADGTYQGLVYLPCTAANDFVPQVPDEHVDVVYLCYPNNPTGSMITRKDLQAWVDYALAHDAIILYDVAYQAFLTDTTLPRSIYEMEGARRCAIEFHSFSKNGGFTGVRCGYTVCPRDLAGTTKAGDAVHLHPLWERRWNTKSNGVSYPVQRGAEAIYSDEGRAQVQALVDFYLANAGVLREACEALDLRVWGGTNAPYVWVACPEGVSSWGMFDRMLEEANVVITPGAGFGACGEGYFRISAFNSRENVDEVVNRLGALAHTASGSACASPTPRASTTSGRRRSASPATRTARRWSRAPRSTTWRIAPSSSSARTSRRSAPSSSAARGTPLPDSTTRTPGEASSRTRAGTTRRPWPSPRDIAVSPRTSSCRRRRCP